MKILIVEPHPDDAVLSCYGYLDKMKEDNDISILNMSSVDGRNSLKFCEYMGINCLDISPDGSDVNFKKFRIPISEIKSHPKPYIYQMSKYSDIAPDIIDSCFHKIYGVLESIKPDIVVGPLGIYHPFHVLTRIGFDAAVGKYKDAKVLLYADKPYSNKQYGLFIIDNALNTDVDAYDLYELTKETVRLKLKIFRKCYPTESIHWDEPGMYQNPEVLFIPINKE